MTRYVILSLSMLALAIGVSRLDARTVDASSNIATENAANQDAEKNKGDEAENEADTDKDTDADKKQTDAEEKSDTSNGADQSEQKTDAPDSDNKDSAEEKKEDVDKAATKNGDEKNTTADVAKKGSDAKPAEKTEAKSEVKKRKTLKIEPKRLKIDLTLDGALVASETEEVAFRPEAWTDYEIVEVVGHGKKVRKGETLFKFDGEKLNEAIADLELEQRISELAILKADDDMPRMEKTLKLDFAAAERANKQSKEDFERYREIDRPMMEKTANVMVKFYDFMLAYEKDELEQLEKMYEADDLTEETEEIVLKRQRTAVEFAEFSLEDAKLNRDQTLNVYLPRYDIRIKDSLERTEMAEARAAQALSLDLSRLRYEQEQRKTARKKSLERHSKLIKDRALMEVKSPADGIVFYGQAVNGRWTDTAGLITKYKPKNKATPNTVLMTIVETRPLYVLASIDEGKRPDIAEGQKVKVSLPSEDAERVAGELKSISPIPVGGAKYEVKFDLTQSDIPDWIAPGMSCKVQLITYDKKDAIVVPKTAVHDDEDDADKKFVWLVKADDEAAKPERRDVKLGKRKGTDVEIIKGLEKGDVISLEDESKKDEEPAKKDS